MTKPDLSTSPLSHPLPLGRQTLSHRLVLAPLTRYRASDTHVPLVPMVPTYYSQRGSLPGTLLITEATFISARASGYANVPGLWSAEQLAAWKEVTEAVHAKGSFIFAQLWALGRTATKEVLEREFGEVVRGVSEVGLPGREAPRVLTEEEIEGLVEDYRVAARNAVEVAGFDGVEIHGANGYLVDQFTQDVSNHRTDSWGGSIPNRSRFALTVARAIASTIGADRTAIRLSPWSTFNAMGMSDPIPQFSYLIRELSGLGLAYLHLVESRIAGNADVERHETLEFAFEAWGGERPVLVAGGFTAEGARAAVEGEGRYAGKKVAIVFGRYYIANPDLPYRVLKGIELTPYDRTKFYMPKQEEGYITYSFSKEFEAQYGKQ